MISLPVIRLKKGQGRRVRGGSPWIYSNELEKTVINIESGEIVRIESHSGEFLGTGYYNPHSLISCRILSRDKGAQIDTDFLATKISNALRLREKFFDKPYYRLIHSEGDLLPGVIIDRFGDAVVIQINSAGMERLKNELIKALDKNISPKTIILRNDTQTRKLEGLELYNEAIKGSPEKLVKIHENGIWYYADLVNGQKTGWFYDQRENRKFVATISRNADVLDAYCHTGGFGILAAKNGARSVAFIDSSKDSLLLAKESAELNKVTCSFLESKVYDEMEKMAVDKQFYDIVVVDPPAFIKSKKDLHSGLRGYEKLAKLAAKIVKPGGFLFIASCSHNAQRKEFIAAVASGLAGAGRNGKIIRISGADIDHPIHPMLPETEYLKTILLQL